MIIGADSTDAVPANPFWDFSLALYRQEGVAPLCLALQDQHGLDVNLLLYAAYAAVCGLSLEPADVEAVDTAVADWREGMLRPLRALRRQLDGGEAPAARQALLQAELALEREQQDRMWKARQPAGRWSPGGQATELRGNLAALAQAGGVAVAELETFASALEHLLPVLLAQG